MITPAQYKSKHLISTIKRSQYSPTLWLLILIVVGLLTACGYPTSDVAISPYPQTTPIPEAFQSATPWLFTPQYSSTPRPSLSQTSVPEHSPSSTTAITSTRTIIPSFIYTPTPVEFSAMVLREPPPGDGRTVVTSFWSEDGLTVYYGLDVLDEGGEGQSPQWFAIDVSTGQEIALSTSPPIVYTPIFINSVYPDYQGFFSPSGRYHLKLTTNNPGIDSQTPVVSTLWLIDTAGVKPTIKVLESADMFYHQAFWFPGETNVVFGVGPEVGTGLYLLEISSGNLTFIIDLTGFNDPNLLEWCLSPDGEKIAVVDGQGNLQVLSLNDGSAINLPGFYQYVRWARDSQMVYYFHGPDWYDVKELGIYDLRSGKMSTLFTLSELEKYGIFGPFDSSPQGDKIVFWGGDEIWLITLSEWPGKTNWQEGDVFVITQAGADLNLRDAPTLSGTILRQLQPGDVVTIISGPVQADGYNWWQMQTGDGTVGWAVNTLGWYEPVSSESTVTPGS